MDTIQINFLLVVPNTTAACEGTLNLHTMRYKTPTATEKYKSRHEEQKIVTRTWFAWLPVYVDQEYRWLETVTVEGYWYIGSVTGEWNFLKKRFIDTEPSVPYIWHRKYPRAPQECIPPEPQPLLPVDKLREYNQYWLQTASIKNIDSRAHFVDWLSKLEAGVPLAQQKHQPQ